MLAALLFVVVGFLAVGLLGEDAPLTEARVPVAPAGPEAEAGGEADAPAAAEAAPSPDPGGVGEPVSVPPDRVYAYVDGHPITGADVNPQAAREPLTLGSITLQAMVDRAVERYLAAREAERLELDDLPETPGLAPTGAGHEAYRRFARQQRLEMLYLRDRRAHRDAVLEDWHDRLLERDRERYAALTASAEDPEEGRRAVQEAMLDHYADEILEEVHRRRAAALERLRSDAQVSRVAELPAVGDEP